MGALDAQVQALFERQERRARKLVTKRWANGHASGWSQASRNMMRIQRGAR
jgi:hypothetical protein